MSILDDPFQNILSNVSLPAEVEILLLQNIPPRWVQCTLLPTEEDGDLLCLKIQEHEAPIITPFGSKIILHFSDEEGPMLSLRYYDQEDGNLFLQFSQVHQRDKRSFPRHYGNIPLNFLTVEQEQMELVSKQWLEKTIDTDNRWSTPEPFMNFSLGGLSFEHSTPIPIDKPMIMEMSIGISSNLWRATGRVVRCIEINKECFDIAVEFNSLPEGALEELSDFTLKVQEALL
jgi:hypothetical protein